jgi:hypothetical protein
VSILVNLGVDYRQPDRSPLPLGGRLRAQLRIYDPHKSDWEVIDECYVDTGSPRTIIAKIHWTALKLEARRLAALIDMPMGGKTQKCMIAPTALYVVDAYAFSPRIETNVILAEEEAFPSILGMDVLSSATLVCQPPTKSAYLVFPTPS